MDIEKAITEVGGALAEDAAESTREVLQTIKREFTTMQSSLGAANADAKTNRLKATDLQQQVEDMQHQIEKLKDSSTVSEMEEAHAAKIEELTNAHTQEKEAWEQERTQFQESQTQLHGLFKTDVMNDISAIAETTEFERIKGNLKLPKLTDEKDMKSFDWENYENEDMLFTKGKLAEYRSLGIFGEALPPIKPNVEVKQEKEEDVDIVELARTNPEKYKELRDKKRNPNSIF